MVDPLKHPAAKYEPINPDVPNDYVEFVNQMFHMWCQSLKIPREMLNIKQLHPPRESDN